MLLKFYADASWSEWEQSLIAANDVREPQVKNLYFFFFFKAIGTIFHGKFITSKLHGILGFGFILWFSGSFSHLHYYSQSILENGKISGEVF